MNESDLGKSLLRGEEPIDLQALTARVLRRDRRSMWFLGIACIIAWMLVVMLPWATILPMMAKGRGTSGGPDPEAGAVGRARGRAVEAGVAGREAGHDRHFHWELRVNVRGGDLHGCRSLSCRGGRLCGR